MNFLISIGPRVPGSEGHKKLREFLYKEFKNMGYLCKVDSFIEDNFKFYNLIFKKGKNNFILLGTHYDTKEGIEGANDSGSGVILLLYLAKKLRDLDKNLLFVFFDGEDFGETPPLYGSRHFAKKNYDIKWGIVFDMIGDKNLEIFMEGYSLKYAPFITDSIFSYAEKRKINFFHKKLKYYIIDDHLPLLEANKKVILLIDFDYPYWHTLEDTWDKISLENIEKLGNFIVDYLKTK